jgi:hypothetical protein
VWNDNAEIMVMLLEAGAPVDSWEEGATPLIYAARLGREAVIPVLVAAGADRSAVDRKGRNLFRLARARKVSPRVLETWSNSRYSTPMVTSVDLMKTVAAWPTSSPDGGVLGDRRRHHLVAAVKPYLHCGHHAAEIHLDGPRRPCPRPPSRR